MGTWVVGEGGEGGVEVVVVHKSLKPNNRCAVQSRVTSAPIIVCAVSKMKSVSLQKITF